MKHKEFIDLSAAINDLAKKSISNTYSIIENELKAIALQYGLLPEQLILFTHPIKNNEIIKYEIAVKVSSFIIKHEINISGINEPEMPKDET